MVLGLLLAAHLACFIASVVMLDAQKQYTDEVDDAGVACIAMHRMAIDCRLAELVHPWYLQVPHGYKLYRSALQVTAASRSPHACLLGGVLPA